MITPTEAYEARYNATGSIKSALKASDAQTAMINGLWPETTIRSNFGHGPVSGDALTLAKNSSVTR